MGLDLTDYEAKACNATMAFWGNRQKALEAKIEAGTVDTGERGAVTAGNTMDGFTALIIDLVQANGLAHAKIYRRRSVLTLPGFFRPTKLWDILVILDGRLIAAVEMKSHVGPSFGNNANNRAEEAIGTAHDFWTAYREGAFGTDTARPFVGWLVMVEDADKSRRPSQRESSRHFPIFEEFRGASYLDRYDILCKKLVLESLYTAACVLASPRSAVTTGVYEDMSDLTSLKSFVASFAAHIAAEAARSQ
ncbi:PaeR7I family type II restriction endonuclease [Gluconacetobacter tumulicola]|uniref:Type-2 restriction enzyme n=1 Tax=Gluconacetobacter tumulicola TaxID=1017177 RepID=A0A7W4JFZ9_9PROT|nr:PaeR7I family type II restriction endonuclease [Gluconacetobacter tumulicola]MBB2180409.1 restriction endonuclease [Gluconacetobacter tumulicola]